MNYKNTAEFKLYSTSKGFTKPEQVLNQIKLDLSKGIRTKINLGPKMPMTKLKKLLQSAGFEVINGISGGCYGSRDGKHYDGFTVFADASLMPDHRIDDDGSQIFNIYTQISNCGGTLYDEMDSHTALEMAGLLSIDVIQDNTYNYEGMDNVYFNIDADFTIIPCRESALLVIKFHCGGDIRGNYTNKVVFIFDSYDSAMSAMYPSALETESETA